MENKDIILYGAGKRGKYVVNKIKELGWNPVAFCDKDDNKIGTIYCGLPVLSKEDIKNKYGNQFQIWITPSYDVRKEIAQEIIELGFVSKEQICNYDNDDTYNEYFSCSYLRNMLVVGEEKISFCCESSRVSHDKSTDNLPHIKTNIDNIDGSINEYIRKKFQLINDLKNGKSCICDGCPNLKRKIWDDADLDVHLLVFNSRFACQLSCCYCFLGSNLDLLRKKPEILEKALNLDLVKVTKTLESKNLINLKYPLQVATGEITINPKKKEILSYLSKYPLQIFSNCVIYDEQVSELIARDGSFLNVSIDAGTPETYKIVKGLDVFDKVVNNIKRYSDEGGNIEIKYILLEDNCDKNNIDGFIEICKNCNLKIVNISVDLFIDNNSMPKSIIEGIIYMANKLHEKNIKYTIFPYFSETDMKYIKSKLKNQFINYE